MTIAGDVLAVRPRLCIVTSELIGPFKNGGIGTSMTGLAQLLAASNFSVTVLYTGMDFVPMRSRTQWVSAYKALGISLEWIDSKGADELTGPLAECSFVAPYLIYEHLKNRTFDIIHFNDCMGEGIYCFAMKYFGAKFCDTALLLTLHSPSQWIWEVNRNPPNALLHAAFHYAERASTRLADALFAPSQYLLDWVKANGFIVPANSIIQQYALPNTPLFEADSKAIAPTSVKRTITAAPPNEIVFFGRIEERKGVKLFVKALKKLEPLLIERKIAVTFMGKEGVVDGHPAFSYLDREAANQRFAVKRITDFGQPEAINYIHMRQALAVMASPADNSPCTVYEALSFGLPFIAARTGGIPELIASEDHTSVLFDYDVDALVARLEDAIRNGVSPARFAKPEQVTREAWVKHLSGWPRLHRSPTARELRRPGIAIVDHGYGGDLAGTLLSLFASEIMQVFLIDRTYGAVVVTHELVLQGLKVDVHEPEASIAALPGFLSCHRGATLFMLRSGVTLIPTAVPSMMEAMRNVDVDGIEPIASIGTGDRSKRMASLGGCPSFSYFNGAASAGLIVAKIDRVTGVLLGSILCAEEEFLGLPDRLTCGPFCILPYPEIVAEHPRAFVNAYGVRSTPERVAAYAAVQGVERYYLTAINSASPVLNYASGLRLRSIRNWLEELGLGWLIGIASRGVVRRIALFVMRVVDV